MRINQGVKIDQHAIAAIKTSGIIGDKYISIALGPSEKILANGATIQHTQAAFVLEDAIGQLINNAGSSNRRARTGTKTRSNKIVTPRIRTRRRSPQDRRSDRTTPKKRKDDDSKFKLRTITARRALLMLTVSAVLVISLAPSRFIAPAWADDPMSVVKSTVNQAISLKSKVAATIWRSLFPGAERAEYSGRGAHRGPG